MSNPGIHANRPKGTKAARRRGTVIAMLWIIGILTLIASAAMLSIRGYSGKATATLQPSDDNAQLEAWDATHEGTIVVQIGQDQCTSIKFDNETGRFDGATLCPTPPLDSRGVPVPLGTMHRLDAIKKSFFSNQR
jgi:hypothetical protein